MFYVYVLLSEKDGNIYTGFTSDLKRRFAEHDRGEVESTRDRRPLILVYYEAYRSEKDARRREHYLKSGGNAKNTLKSQILESIGP